MMKRSLAIIGAAALLLTAAPAANAEDSSPHNTNQGSTTDLNEFVVDSPIYGIIAIPVTLSSIALSFIGIPQCGLHDTRGCKKD
ncbi:hypothetical protein [Corynebacterium minutissimum]|uniref:Secreted protein n=2 Tax=Corynebacterium minutissimum TaxID=38301 RepID=A0A2X4UBA9_9CORY|nr:hypothetical protein [Corynebacterium minutissimum]SQH99875.1 Uncharacterised protein [Corynebacterium minutissimum]VEG06058.1 Uncharacterised protein [Corynebacterium minutissimum]